MKAVHIATIDMGGAYKAAERICKSLSTQGISNRLILRTKNNPENYGEGYFSEDLKGKVGRFLSKAGNVINQLISSKEIDTAFLGTNVSRDERIKEADVIFIHWVNSFLSYRNIRQLIELKKPTVIVMHDMWLFTGGCHLDRYCKGYENACINCERCKRSGIASKNFEKKIDMLKDAPNVIITGPSTWITGCAQKSLITNQRPIMCVHNPMDKSIFKMNDVDIKELRRKYGLNPDKFVILFGAMDATSDENKGFAFLKDAMNKLPADKYEAFIFGATDEMLEHLGINIHCKGLGFVSTEEELADIYRLADVFVAPSLQESFSYTVCEAHNCGTFTVTFPVGGILDQVEQKGNGYLAEYKNSDDLCAGVRWACEENRGRNSYSLLDNDYKSTGRKFGNVLNGIL